MCEIIFSKDNMVGGLWSIDLEALKLSKLNFAKIGRGGGLA